MFNGQWSTEFPPLRTAIYGLGCQMGDSFPPSFDKSGLAKKTPGPKMGWRNFWSLKRNSVPTQFVFQICCIFCERKKTYSSAWWREQREVCGPQQQKMWSPAQQKILFHSEARVPRVSKEGVANGTNVWFDGFLWSSPFTCIPICLRPGGRGSANKLEGKWQVSLCFVAPTQAAAEYDINSSFC